jgi:hypothetical protein
MAGILGMSLSGYVLIEKGRHKTPLPVRIERRRRFVRRDPDARQRLADAGYRWPWRGDLG